MGWEWEDPLPHCLEPIPAHTHTTASSTYPTTIASTKLCKLVVKWEHPLIIFVGLKFGTFPQTHLYLQTRSTSFSSEKERNWKTRQSSSGGSFELIFVPNTVFSSAIVSTWLHRLCFSSIQFSSILCQTLMKLRKVSFVSAIFVKFFLLLEPRKAVTGLCF